MQPHIMAILIVAYLMIGTFFGVLFNHIFEPIENVIAFVVFLLFWPLILAALLLLGLFCIPVKIAGWIYDKFEDVFNKIYKIF